MPTFGQKFASFFSRGARMFSRPTSPSPQPGAVAGYPNGGMPASVPLPGVSPYASTPRTHEELARAMLDPQAYFGRVSYDAGPSQTRFSSYPATDLTPAKIAGAQLEATSGYPLRWSEMIEQILSRDAHLSGIAQQRVDDVVKGSWSLVRSTPDDLGASLRGFVEEALRGVDTLDDALAWLLWANAYGYAACEVVWGNQKITFPGPDGKRIGPIDAIVPVRLVPVHPKHFRFDMRTDEPQLWLGSSTVSLPCGKFVFNRGEGQHPITARRGYMWPCAWLSMFKSNGWAGWAAFVDRYGMPSPLIEYNGTMAQYAEYKQAMNEILNNLGQGLGAILPENAFKVTIPTPPTGGRSSDPHSALSDACDAAQSIRVLGATLTAKIGNVGSFAASSTHADVKYAREEADARRLWATLRSELLSPMVAFNREALCAAISDRGVKDCTPDMLPRRVPRGLHRVPREIDPVQRMQLIVAAVNDLGLEVGREPLFHEFNLPQPMGPDDVAPGRPENVTRGGKIVGAVEAANQGAEAPVEPQSGQSAGEAVGSEPPPSTEAPGR